MNSYVKDYPRPQLFRKDYKLLNGDWDFTFDDANEGEKSKWHEGFEKQHDIKVPFTYETQESGIGDETEHKYLWYSRTFSVAKPWLDNKTMLHFEGSDYVTKAWVNGIFVGQHKGGYARFSFDLSNALVEGDNSIVVKIEDSHDTRIPRGKQRWTKENFGCWYVQTTGIWKTVWIENVNKTSIANVKMTPSIGDRCIIIEGEIDGCTDANLALSIDITYKGLPIRRVTLSVTGEEFFTKIDVTSLDTPQRIHYWSPNSPALYDISFSLKDAENTCDTVLSYFGMREIRIRDSNILLNGYPLYQRLILDQGYWETSHLTPPSEDALIEDIDKVMALGYNGVRKHQKTEDERFLYWCDVKGLLVWSEMAAAYTYSDYAIENFTREWVEIVRQNYNHPSIITWTPINESWGVGQIETDIKQQKFSEAIYNITKSIDSMRPVIVNDGWEHTVSDIITLHDYEVKGSVFFNRYFHGKDDILASKLYHNLAKSAMAEGYAYKGQPVIISEYGGISFTGDDASWGYGGKVRTEEEFLSRFEDITNAIKKLPYVCGYCYTQVTDVQQETNGLMDSKRNYKVNPDAIKKILLQNIVPSYLGFNEN